MATKRYKFQLNTSASCFLCLKKYLNADEKKLNGHSFSLQNIFQYLSIELSKIKTLSTKPIDLLNKTDVRVSLCNECGEIFDDISKLYKNLEIIQMKLNCNFERIQKIMKLSFDELKTMNGQNNQGELEKSSEEIALRHSTLVTVLREEILGKWKRKMPNYHPRIKLAKLFFTHQPQKNLKQELLDDHYDPETGIGLDDLVDENEEDFNLRDEVCKINSLSFKSETSAAPGSESNNSFQSQQEKFMLQNEVQGETLLKSEANTYMQTNGRKTVRITKRLSCKKCDKTFKGRAGLSNHYRTVHLYQRFKCKTCKKVYKYKSDLGFHKKTCLPDLKQRPLKDKDRQGYFGCDICEKKFYEKDKLKRHRKWVHETVDRYPCDVCDKKFKMFFHLQQHKESVHLGKKFFCRFCTKMYRSKGAVWKHEKKCSQNNQLKMFA